MRRPIHASGLLIRLCVCVRVRACVCVRARSYVHVLLRFRAQIIFNYWSPRMLVSVPQKNTMLHLLVLVVPSRLQLSNHMDNMALAKNLNYINIDKALQLIVDINNIIFNKIDFYNKIQFCENCILLFRVLNCSYFTRKIHNYNYITILSVYTNDTYLII